LYKTSDGDGSDGCARRWTQILARDRNLLMLALWFLGTLVAFNTRQRPSTCTDQTQFRLSRARIAETMRVK
jgi:hypothetical protein